MRSDRPRRFLIAEEASQIIASDLNVIFRSARKKQECLILINQDVAGLKNDRVDVSQTALSQPGITLSFQQKAKFDIEELVYTFATGMLDFSLVWKPMDRPDGWDDEVIPEYGEEESNGETWNTTRAVATSRGTGREISFGSMIAQEQSSGRDIGVTNGLTNRTTEMESQEHSTNTGQSKSDRIQNVRDNSLNGNRRIAIDEDANFSSDTDTAKSGTSTGMDRKHEQHRTDRKSQSVKHGQDQKESQSFRTTETATDTQGVGGMRSRKTTLTYRHHLLPRTKEEWYPQGLLYSIPEQYAMVAKELRMLGKQEMLICWGNEPTRFCRVDDFPRAFTGLPSIREWKVKKFTEWLWSVHGCFFTVQEGKKWDRAKEKSAAKKYS